MNKITNEKNMLKLRDVLNAINGETHIMISVDCKYVFIGRRVDTLKDNFDIIVGPYLDHDVYRINALEGSITLAV